MKLTMEEVIKIWEELHIRNTGDIGFCDLEKAINDIVGISDCEFKITELPEAKELLQVVRDVAWTCEDIPELSSNYEHEQVIACDNAITDIYKLCNKYESYFGALEEKQSAT